MRKVLLVAVVIVLLALPATTAGAQRFAPLNYCTSVTSVLGGDTDAIGAGRYARIVEYPVANPAVVIVATDFGLGATEYHWSNPPLTERQYQVQVSHTSLTTGYSTTGCVFTPHPPLANQIDGFTATCLSDGMRFQWDVSSEAGIVEYLITLQSEPTNLPIATIYSSCPGCMMPASYVTTQKVHVDGTYWLTAGPSATSFTVSCAVPTAVRLSRFTAR